MKIDKSQLIPFSSAQRVVGMQLMYSLAKNVINIFTSYNYDGKRDFALMQEALNETVRRNGALRIQIFKIKRERYQYIRENVTYPLNEITFTSKLDKENFEKEVAKKAVKWKKGEILRAYLAHNYDGNDILYTQICHFAADMAGCINFYTDFNAVYDALKNKTEMPKLPADYASVAKRDAQGYQDKEKLAEEDKYYRAYFGKHKEPAFAGLNGKIKANGTPFKYDVNKPIKIPLINNQTVSAQYDFDLEISKQVNQFCLDYKCTIGNFYYLLCCLCAAKLNEVETMLPIELINCRATLADKTVIADKAQTIVNYVTIPSDSTFLKLLADFGEEQSTHLRHVGFDDMKLQYATHGVWKYPMTSTYHPFMFSMVPSINKEKEGVNVLPNGRFALPAYLAFMIDMKTGILKVGYDCQKKYIDEQDILRFHKTLQKVAKQIIDNPEVLIKDIKL